MASPALPSSLRDSDALETLTACYVAVLNRRHLPRFSWTADSDGAIKVHTVDRPSAVKLWQATNPSARDFRLEIIGRAWTGQDLADQGGGTYVARVPKPAKGWTAFVVELTYPQPEGPAPFKFTTDVHVVPDVLPFKFRPKSPPP